MSYEERAEAGDDFAAERANEMVESGSFDDEIAQMIQDGNFDDDVKERILDLIDEEQVSLADIIQNLNDEELVVFVGDVKRLTAPTKDKSMTILATVKDLKGVMRGRDNEVL